MKRPGGFDGAEYGGAAPESAPVSEPLPEPIPLSKHRTESLGDLTAPQGDLAVPQGDLTAPQGDLEVPREQKPDDSVRIAELELKRARRSVRKRERREQRRFTAHLRRRRRYWFVAVGAVLALMLFVAIGVLSPLTAVREVRISGASQVNVGDLQTALARFEGVPLALVGEQDVHRVLEPFPLIQRYAIERIPPHTLVVRIEERDAVMALERDGALQLLDPAGVLIGTADERPVGVPLAREQAVDPSSPAFSAAGRVIRDLPPDIREQLAEVSATSAQDVSFILTSGTQVIWGEAAETQRKAIVLRSILSAVGAVARIDVSSPNAPVFQ